MIRVMIADDEPLARRTLKRLLEYDPDVEVVGETAGSDTLERIRAMRPDLVMLDIQMPGMTGFEVLEQLEPDELPLVVFVTAYDEFALRAFDLHALDYVVKPFTDRRIIEALRRAKDLIQRRETEATQRRLLQLLRSRLARQEDDEGMTPDRTLSAPPSPGRIAVRDGSRVLMLQAREVAWIEAEGSYSRIHLDGRSELVRATLGSLEEQLDPQRFFRIHRSAIVSLDRVQEIRHESHGDYLVVLREGTELRLARSRREEFEVRVGLRSA